MSEEIMKVGSQEIVVAAAAGFPAGHVGLTIRSRHGKGVRTVLTSQQVNALADALRSASRNGRS